MVPEVNLFQCSDLWELFLGKGVWYQKGQVVLFSAL
jgi:hypothetical protein